MSSHSSDPEFNVWDPIGKTPKEIVACYVENERCQKREMAKRSLLGIEGIHYARTAACTL